ncbi:hypothetical protein C7M84_004530 [Penaeus vannamei]|uniref:Uncharacterized protein n=1 Tax=Penaeus vannamei TaxID=6689 RepID=A0A3R7QST5_PENVA|nr:hypothetical protein C7M84_004530 [Penaeus vannamei]
MRLRLGSDRPRSLIARAQDRRPPRQGNPEESLRRGGYSGMEITRRIHEEEGFFFNPSSSPSLILAIPHPRHPSSSPSLILALPHPRHPSSSPSLILANPSSLALPHPRPPSSSPSLPLAIPHPRHPSSSPSSSSPSLILRHHLAIPHPRILTLILAILAIPPHPLPHLASLILRPFRSSKKPYRSGAGSPSPGIRKPEGILTTRRIFRDGNYSEDSIRKKVFWDNPSSSPSLNPRLPHPRPPSTSPSLILALPHPRIILAPPSSSGRKWLSITGSDRPRSLIARGAGSPSPETREPRGNPRRGGYSGMEILGGFNEEEGPQGRRPQTRKPRGNPYDEGGYSGDGKYFRRIQLEKSFIWDKSTNRFAQCTHPCHPLDPSPSLFLAILHPRPSLIPPSSSRRSSSSAIPHPRHSLILAIPLLAPSPHSSHPSLILAIPLILALPHLRP